MSHMKDLEEYPTSELKQELIERSVAREHGLCDYCGRPLDTTPLCRFPTRHASKEV